MPWEWTEEARRKDQKGYAKCWRRIWKERKSRCGDLIAELQKEIKRLGRELQILTAIHAHRTNQIVRISALAATNTFPCRVSVERLEKGRLWGWNKSVEEVECKDSAAVMTAADSIYSNEVSAAQREIKDVMALTDSIAAAKEKSALNERLREICDKSIGLIDDESLQGRDDALLSSLVEVLKGAKE